MKRYNIKEVEKKPLEIPLREYLEEMRARKRPIMIRYYAKNKEKFSEALKRSKKQRQRNKWKKKPKTDISRIPTIEYVLKARRRKNGIQ